MKYSGNRSRYLSILFSSNSLLLVAITLGILTAFFMPTAAASSAEFIDHVILLLLFLIFLEMPINTLFKKGGDIRFLSIACCINFIVIPICAIVIAHSFFSNHPAFYVGLCLYLFAPCTDWFLGFTRMAKGNVELGVTLIPINMLVQLMLLPIFLFVIGTANNASIMPYDIVIDWFVTPLILALVFRTLFHKQLDTLLAICRSAIPVVLAMLLFLIFANNSQIFLDQLKFLPKIAMAIMLFFVLIVIIAELTTKAFNLQQADHALLAFTTSARNAPLMLAVATAIFPEQPLIYATISIGMLIEFPHLMTLKSYFLTKRNKKVAIALSMTAHEK